jgi:hypothetical protein
VVRNNRTATYDVRLRAAGQLLGYKVVRSGLQARLAEGLRSTN